MKFTILTLYYNSYNFGGLLQAYALQKSVVQQGVKCEVLSYQFRKSAQERMLWRKQIIREHFQESFMSGISFLFSKVRVKIFFGILQIFYKKGLEMRQKRFAEFEQQIPHSSRVYHVQELKSCVDSYDGFICGGDQVWNNWESWETNAVKGFTLEFVPDHKIKFAYAPSTGTISHEEAFQEQLQPGLQKLDYVSVREKSSIPYIESLCGKKTTAVLDPVMLLDKAQWKSAVQEEAQIEIPQKKYLLAYFLGNDRSQRRAAKKIARSKNLALVTFPYIGGMRNWTDIGFGDIRMFDAGPMEFVRLILNAELVLTDSFHGSVFSIIFEKDFYVFERDMKVGERDMNIRINDLLDEFGLLERKVSAEMLLKKKTFKTIDYKHVYKILAGRRNESMEYLREALENDKTVVHGCEAE